MRRWLVIYCLWVCSSIYASQEWGAYKHYRHENTTPHKLSKYLTRSPKIQKFGPSQQQRSYNIHKKATIGKHYRRSLKENTHVPKYAPQTDWIRNGALF